MNFFNLLASKITGSKMFGASTFVYQAKLFDKPRRTELEVRNAGDNVSTIMGTKLNDGVAIYGIAYDDNMITGLWYSAYLISKDPDAIITTESIGANEFTYDGETWYFSTKRTNTSNTTTYTDGIVIPYNAKKLSGKNAAIKILDYYFYKI